MKKLRFLAIFGVIMLTLQGLYAQYTGQQNFSLAEVTTTQTDGWDIATLVGCNMEVDVGKPYLPVKHLHIAIPEDKDVVGIQILSMQQQELTGTYNIMPTQLEQIPGEAVPEFVNPDPAIYNMNAQYPAEYIYSPTAGFKSGVHIAGILFYPLRYNPVTRKLYLITQIQYQLVYADANHNPVKPRRMLHTSYMALKDEIKSTVSNPTDIDTYFQLEKTDVFSGKAFLPNEFPDFNGQAVEYVIITNLTLAEGFQEIADWKTRKGVPAVVRTVEWIYSHYPGVDQAEKVRNFIIDAYQNWGTQYFMLGGDSDVVPIRYAWTSHWNYYADTWPDGHTIPADMYYACLDNNWNADGDATFGEADWDRHNDGTFANTNDPYANIDNVDRLPDVVIGRVPVEDYLDDQGELVELDNFKTKFFEYVKTSQGNENNCLLFNSMEPGYHIYQVKSSFPSYINFTERYNNEGYNNMDVLDELNGIGVNNTSHHIICGLGHGGPTSFAAAEGSLNRIHMDGLINSDKSQILYLANHCSTMPWDNNTVTEHYLNSENGGVAVIANTAIGWTSMVNGYNKPFIEKIYNTDNHIGISFTETKKLYNNQSYKDGTYRLIFFSLSLAADPEMPVWTDSPDPQNPLVVVAPTNVYTGEQSIAIQINNLANGAEAMVCLYKDGEVYAREPVTGTGSLQTVNLQCTPDTEGEILVTVTAKNYLPIETAITVSANPATNLYVSNYRNGGDEYIDAGETVRLNIELNNSGLTTASNVYAVVTCNDDFITVQNHQSSYGTIAAGASVWGQSSFVFNVDAAIEDDKVATFNLTAYDAANNTYQDEVLIEIKSPTIEQRSKSIIHTTGGDMIIVAGDVVQFDIDLFNNSLSFVQNVNATLSTTSMFVESIQQSQGAYGSIASFETNTNTNEYIFEVSNNYPGAPEPILFDLDVTNSFGQQWQFTFDLLEKPDISCMAIDFRGKLTSIALFWTVYEDILGYNIYRSDTENGLYVKQNTQILPVAYFEDTGLQELTTYYYKVSVVSLTGNESELSQAKQAWTSLAYHPDWLPVTVSNEDHGYFWGAPNVYDLENDGEKEIFIASGTGDHACDTGTIFAFRHDGEELYDIDNNPTTVSGFANIGISMTCTPAIGDIDNDGIAEIIVATRMGNPDDATKRKLFVYKNTDVDNDNKPDLMLEKQISFKNFNGVVLADMDNNNTLEIIVPNQKGEYIEIFDYLGNNYPGWPANPGESPSDLKAVSMPVAVDLDGDNLKEIVIGLEDGIYIYNNNGTDFITGQNPVYTDGGRLDCPVIAADIDNDGTHEILFMSIQNTTGYIYAMESTGDLVSGWNSNNHDISLSIHSQTWAWPPAFVCGDIDLDGKLEVAVADADMLKVWNNLGDLILEKNIPLLDCKYLQPLIADIDSDASDCEIIIPSNNGVIHAYKLNGNSVLGWPLYLGSTTSIPLIEDIDNDSKNEIIAASGSDIFVWDTEGSGDIQWGRARLNSHNNGVIQNPCAYNPVPLTVNEDQTWASDLILDRDLYVENAILTIKSKISFPTQAKVVVKPGAKLVIDGGTLTNACNESWQGIQVWGNSTASQYALPGQPNAQGKLVLENGATIENAVNAVTLWKPGDWNTNGGIVVANGARFINNRRSAEFRSYQNIHPISGEPMGNVSRFTACHFEVNDDYSIADDPFNCHISMFNVDGINLTGNSFLNQMTADGNTGAGIISIDANYNVLAGCNSTVVPCPPADFITNYFEGFAYGIDASNSSSLTKTIYVRQAEFANNGYGIRLNSVHNATIIQNNFTVGTYGKGDWMCDTDFGIGIELAGCNNYAVEENTFTPISALGTIPYMGIRVLNNDEDNVERNEIYFNTFDQMNRANQADGINYIVGEAHLGLNYRCNQNTNNYFDFVATGQGIAGHQSSPGYAADNTFTVISLPPSDPRHFFNDAINHVTYYYRPNMPNAQPLYVYNVTTTPFGSVPPGPCSSNYGGGNEEINLQGLTESQKQHFEQELTDSHTAYTGVQSLYTSLIDGGNTDAVQAEIAMAWPEDMWELRAELLGLSPLLSKDVLVSASDRTDVLPESIIFEVLSANPDELKKKELIEHLETKDNPLPAYMIEILESLADNVTYKTILQSQMAHYGRMEGRAAGILLRDMLRDSTTAPESIRTFMAERQSLPMDMQRVDSYLESGETAQALALAASLPQQYGLDGEALAEHDRFVQLKQLQAGLHDQGRNIFQLTPTEKDQLEALVEQSSGTAGRQARSILAFVYEEAFCDCPADINPELKARTFVQPPLDKLDEAQISVRPNPAKTWVSFDYTIPGSSNKAILEIRDATAKLVYQTTLENEQGQYVWDTRDIAPGLYYYTMKTTHGIKSGKVTVVR